MGSFFCSQKVASVRVSSNTQMDGKEAREFLTIHKNVVLFDMLKLPASPPQWHKTIWVVSSAAKRWLQCVYRQTRKWMEKKHASSYIS